MAKTIQLTVDAAEYQDEDDCLAAAAAADYARRHKLERWQVEARWVDEERDRSEIVIEAQTEFGACCVCASGPDRAKVSATHEGCEHCGGGLCDACHAAGDCPECEAAEIGGATKEWERGEGGEAWEDDQ